MHLLVSLTALLLLASHFVTTCDVRNTNVDEESKKAIVEKINYFRANVAKGNVGSSSKTANMLEMVWDEATAQRAQDLACSPRKVTVIENRLSFNDISELVQPNWNKVLQYWFGHDFTEMIWPDSYKVGCGYAMNPLFPPHVHGNLNSHMYTCIFGPDGIIRGKPIYEEGEPCSSCGGCGLIEGLCKAPENENYNVHLRGRRSTDYEDDLEGSAKRNVRNNKTGKNNKKGTEKDGANSKKYYIEGSNKHNARNDKIIRNNKKGTKKYGAHSKKYYTEGSNKHNVRNDKTQKKISDKELINREKHKQMLKKFLVDVSLELLLDIPLELLIQAIIG